MQKFVTLFNASNVHLIKDVGLIPYGLYRSGFYDSYIATYKKDSLAYLDNSVKGLKLWAVNRITGKYIIDASAFLIRHSKSIDVLNIYHTTFRSSVFTFLYKHLNSKGILYVKLDGGFTREETKWNKSFRKYVMRKADIITTELEEKRKLLEKSWNRKVSLLRNPFHPGEIKKYITYDQRDNIILTVGRLGTPEKNTETLLESFALAADRIPQFKLILVGSVEENFQTYITEFTKRHAELKERIEFVGNIDDRDILFDYYIRSKVFVFPSKWESYGIALMEAGLCGTFIICSDIPASKELTDNFKNCAHFQAEDTVKLAELLVQYCNNEIRAAELGFFEREYIIKQCRIETVSNTLYNLINSHNGG